MFCKRAAAILAAMLCMNCLVLPAAAVEVSSDAVYCFSPEDFSEETSITGICITDLPQNAGALMLGSRILREGDILTAQQVSQMTFAPASRETDTSVELGYLPVFSDHVAEGAVMTLSIRGKENKEPVAEDSAMETYKNLSSTSQLKASDPEGEALSYTILRQPRRGTVEIGPDGSFTYTPKKNKIGVDSFTYTATDPAGKVSREATVTITILKPTQAPQYTDTMGKECRFTAEWMKHTGIFVGESVADSPCFHPDWQVSRGQFVTMLVKALNIPTEEEVTYTGYADEVPQWLQPYLAAAVRSGITSRLENQTTFGADVPISGMEAAAMLDAALDADFTGLTNAPLTRGEAAQILYEAVKIQESSKIDTLV